MTTISSDRALAGVGMKTTRIDTGMTTLIPRHADLGIRVRALR
jgi:hypothetical protein